jgi:hypothetical protein
VPVAEKVAVLLAVLVLPKVTMPGPLTLLHVSVSGPGKPSSVTVASRMRPVLAGRLMVGAVGLVMVTLGATSLSAMVTVALLDTPRL